MIKFFGQQHATEVLSLLSKIQINKKTTSNECLPQGILCFGDPGTGKTLFAKKAAEVLHKELIIVDSSMGSDQIKAIFNGVKMSGDQIILLDEIELICHNDHIGLLLTELDGNPNLFVIATTSDDIDEDYFWQKNEALIRPGRFDITIHFKLPNYDDRYDFIVDRLKDKCDYNIKLMATITKARSYAFIETFIKRLEMEIENNLMTYSDQAIIEVYDKVYSHENYEIINNQYQSEVIAVHEIGHFIMGSILNKNPELIYFSKHKVSGYTIFSEDMPSELLAFNELCILLSGYCSVKLIKGIDDIGGSLDFGHYRQAFHHLFVNTYKFKKTSSVFETKHGYSAVGSRYEKLFDKTFKFIYQYNLKTLKKFKENIISMSTELAKYQTINVGENLHRLQKNKNFKKAQLKHQKYIKKFNKIYY